MPRNIRFVFDPAGEGRSEGPLRCIDRREIEIPAPGDLIHLSLRTPSENTARRKASLLPRVRWETDSEPQPRLVELSFLALPQTDLEEIWLQAGKRPFPIRRQSSWTMVPWAAPTRSVVPKRSLVMAISPRSQPDELPEPSLQVQEQTLLPGAEGREIILRLVSAANRVVAEPISILTTDTKEGALGKPIELMGASWAYLDSSADRPLQKTPADGPTETDGGPPLVAMKFFAHPGRYRFGVDVQYDGRVFSSDWVKLASH